MSPAKPSHLEMQILSVLWRDGPSSVRHVRERLPDGKERAYTTVLSTLQVMEKKGLVTHTRKGLAHIYRPAITERQAKRGIVRDLVGGVFGSASAAVQTLLAEGEFSDEEMREIQRMIDDHLKGTKPKGGRSPR